MPDKPLNVALVGYGLAGKVFHAPLITTTPGLKLAAVVSSRKSEVEADLLGVTCFFSLDSALAAGGIDLVVVATPNDSHAPLASQAMAKGCPVVVDKPFTVTLAEAETLRDQARRDGVVLSVFHNRRYASDFLTLQRILQAGELGDIAHFEAHFDRFRPIARDRWRERPGPGAGMWYDLGSHLIDQALTLFGPPEAIWVDLAAQRGEGTSTDWFHAVLRYPRMRAVLNSGTIIAEPGPTLAAHGTKGSWVKHGLDPQEEQAKQGMAPGDPGWGVDPNPGVITTVRDDGKVERRTPEALPGDYGRYYAAIRDAIAAGGPNPVTADDAIQVMRLIELGIESSARRCELAVPYSN
jgi:predicted dehydrogenase